MTYDWIASVRIKNGLNQNRILADVYWLMIRKLAYQDIFDVEYDAFNDPGSHDMPSDAKRCLMSLDRDMIRWLKTQKITYRIEATYVSQSGTAAELGMPLVAPDTDVMCYGYNIDVWFEDKAMAMLFKLTWGGQ